VCVCMRVRVYVSVYEREGVSNIRNTKEEASKRKERQKSQPR